MIRIEGLKYKKNRMSGKKHQIANNQDKDKTIPFKEKRCFIKNVFLNPFQKRTERIKLKREILK